MRSILNREAEPDVVFRCGTAERWLPRTLAGAVLVTALLGALKIDPRLDALAGYVRPFVALAGGLLALVIVRQGGELRWSVGLTREALVLRAGSRMKRLEFAEIVRLDYAAPFTASARWLPAAILHDERGQMWRIPALLRGGDRLFRELLRRAGRNDLDAWAAAHRIVERMGRAGRWVAAGYAAAALILLVGLVYNLG